MTRRLLKNYDVRLRPDFLGKCSFFHISESLRVECGAHAFGKYPTPVKNMKTLICY